MARRLIHMGMMVLAAAFCAASAQAQAVFPSTMTYQGRLKESGSLVTGTRSVEVFLCDAITAGNCYSVSGPQNVSVQNGLFRSTYTLPGNVDLTLQPWFLEARVGGTPLSPREQLTTTPYSFYSQMANGVMSILPVNQLFNITPVNAVVTSGGGYTVPGGSNLIIFSVDRQSNCFPGVPSVGWLSNCWLRVTGTHSGTTILAPRSKTNAAILGSGDVVDSTSAAITHRFRGALVPNVVQVVLQDVAGSGGTYSVPGGKTFYFAAHATTPGCTGNVNIGGFVASMSSSFSQGGMLNSGQNFQNNTNCTVTLNGYLK